MGLGFGKRACGDFVICDEIDLCDVDFYQRALALLDSGAAEDAVRPPLATP